MVVVSGVFFAHVGVYGRLAAMALFLVRVRSEVRIVFYSISNAFCALGPYAYRVIARYWKSNDASAARRRSDTITRRSTGLGDIKTTGALPEREPRRIRARNLLCVALAPLRTGYSVG